MAIEEELATVMPAEGLYNVAKGKEATQSSVGWSGVASRAVDGWGALTKTTYNE